LESNLYDERVQKRFLVTKEVVEQNKISHLSYTPQGTTKLIQSFDTLLFGSFATYYLAMLYDVDPAPNPWVDYFKKRLKEL
jgi:glucose/mannose-6-phosphate isomerase